VNKTRDQDEPVLWRVLDAAHELETRLETALAAIDLSLPKLGVLKILADAKEPLPLSEIAEHSHCVRSNMTQLVDRLAADGLVRRVNDAGDRRIRRASLTAAGRKACKQGTRIVETHEREVAGTLSQADATALARALGRLVS
jgi:DNA-binding MarR family transcriptional regulator